MFPCLYTEVFFVCNERKYDANVKTSLAASKYPLFDKITIWHFSGPFNPKSLPLVQYTSIYFRYYCYCQRPNNQYVLNWQYVVNQNAHLVMSPSNNSTTLNPFHRDACTTNQWSTQQRTSCVTEGYIWWLFWESYFVYFLSEVRTSHLKNFSDWK